MANQRNKVCLVLNVFNEADQLGNMWQSVRDKVDFVVAADGAYENFPSKTAMSNDGTQEILEEIADKIITQDKCWKDEATKRNALLDAVPDGYWILRVDADEVLAKWNPDIFEELESEGALFCNALVKHFDEVKTAQPPRQMHEPVLLSPDGDWAYQRHDSLVESGKQLHEVPSVTTRAVTIHNKPGQRPSTRASQRRLYREENR